MVEAVIFDMDGLLIDSEPFWVETERRVFGSVGLRLSESDCSNTAGLRIDEVVDYWFDRKPWQGKSRKEVETEIVSGVKASILADGKLLDGVWESLKFLSDLEIPCALASSSNLELIETSIRALDIESFFQSIHSAQFEKRGKPYPDIFLTASKTLGISPVNCLVLEDSASGAKAAKRAMMPFVAIPNASPKESPIFLEALALLSNMEEFPAWFTEYRSL